MRTVRPVCGDRRLSRELVHALQRRRMFQECGPLPQVRANVPSMLFGQGVASSAPDDDLRRNALRRWWSHVRNTTGMRAMRLEIST